jgi:hypothetical protein
MGKCSRFFITFSFFNDYYGKGVTWRVALLNLVPDALKV